MNNGKQEVDDDSETSSNESSNEKIELIPEKDKKDLQILDAIYGGAGVMVKVTDLTTEYTVDDAITSIGIGCFQFKLILITGCLFATEAIEMMIITIIQPTLINQWNLNHLSAGSIAICVYAGMLYGTFILSTIADKYGRKRVIILSIIGYSLFSFISAFSSSYALLLITRFCVGFFIGGNAVAFTLFAEFCPTEKRGRMLVIQQAFWCFGSVFSSTIGWLCMDYLNWQWFIICACLPLWIVSFFIWWIPESPHYLMTVGKYEETKNILKRMAMTNQSNLPNGYLKTDIILHKSRGRLKDVFSAQYRVTSILLYVMLVTAVFSYYGLSFIGERIFEQDKGDEYAQNLLSAFAEIPALFIGLIVIDRIGRKSTLNICFVLYSVACFLLYFPAIRSVDSFGVALIFIGRMFISLAFMTQFIYFSEFYPTAIRATAIGGASSLDELSKIAANYLAEDVEDISKGMIIFGCVGLIALMCSFFLPFETLGRQLHSNVDYASEGVKGTMKIKMMSSAEDDKFDDRL